MENRVSEFGKMRVLGVFLVRGGERETQVRASNRTSERKIKPKKKGERKIERT